MPSSGIGPVPISPFSDWKNTLTSAGIWFATSVGMPMPRLTSIPGRNSRAMRFAIMVCASIVVSRVCDEIINYRRRRYHVVGRDETDRHYVLGGRNRGLAGHRDHRIEISARQRIRNVAEIVGQEARDQREVGA